MFQPDQLTRLVPLVRQNNGKQHRTSTDHESNGHPSADGQQPAKPAGRGHSPSGVSNLNPVETLPDWGHPDQARTDEINPHHSDPISATELLAHDYLVKGGKYARPFITLAAYDALTGSQCTGPDGPQHVAEIPDAVLRVALSIEVFHKASLVHDDIEDDDAYRYGVPTLHRKLGIPTAINIGDYLIGLGYRLVGRETKTLGAEVACDILDFLADAHCRLSEGQGAELLWRDAHNRMLTPVDALRIYALKTAPAFEAALLCGLRCAGPLGPLQGPAKQLARHLGIAFQILNDLKDWHGDQDNKMAAGLDTLGGRPTILWALALQSMGSRQQEKLLQIIQTDDQPTDRVRQVRQIYLQTDVFQQARQLVTKYRQRAEAVANELEPESFRTLLHYLIHSVLDEADAMAPELVLPS